VVRGLTLSLDYCNRHHLGVRVNLWPVQVNGGAEILFEQEGEFDDCVLHFVFTVVHSTKSKRAGTLPQLLIGQGAASRY
jgi:hypothetical protein